MRFKDIIIINKPIIAGNAISGLKANQQTEIVIPLNAIAIIIVIKNAVNYSKENTDIDISILNKENQATVKITNKGKQIPKEKLDKIFEKFYRLDSSRTSKTGGSGLGLAIAKEIVELHGGRIYAESDMKETTFSVILPIIEQA